MLKVVAGAGGKVTGETVEIPQQQPKAPPLKQWEMDAVSTILPVADPAWTFDASFSKERRAVWLVELPYVEANGAGATATLNFSSTGVTII